MQSTWGPRIFWLVVFVIAGLGVYAFFYDPADDLGRIGYVAPLTNMVSIRPDTYGAELHLGLKDRKSSSWKGDIKLAKGKLLQLYLLQAGPSSTISAASFDCVSEFSEDDQRPVVLRIVYQAPADDTLILTINQQTQQIPLADLTQGKQLDLQDGTVRLNIQPPQQLFENDTSTDDWYPQTIRDGQGNDYLLYLNSERSKGIDVNGAINGSFETLESPITGVTLRISRFQDGAWQYSEAVTSRLETCLDPVIAIDPSGRIYVAWAQRELDGWDIYYQFRDIGLSWSKPVKLTSKAGSCQQLVAQTDSLGKVWLAWQTWMDNHYDIMAAVINDEKHAWKTPGPLADHPQDCEGRWFPALAADRQGNLFAAWSVFRNGNFVIEAVKVHENKPKSHPVYLSEAGRNALRPALACDANNLLWVAYEESETVSGFGNAQLPTSSIRIRTLRQDGSLDERPLIKTPSALKGIIQKNRCYRPHLSFSSSNMPVVGFQTPGGLYASYWTSSGWAEPIALSKGNKNPYSHSLVLHQANHLVGLEEVVDSKGRVRLSFASQPVVLNALEIPPAPGTKAVESKTENPWKAFSELARLFRKRSDDLILSKRYLLRGLTLLPEGVAALGYDPWLMAALATEQALYDWVMIPYLEQVPLVRQWENALRAHAINQTSDRNFLVGYYRPLAGQREPLLHIDTKKDEWPLPPITRLDDFRKPNDKPVRISQLQTTDRNMIRQYVNQRQRLGFSLTEEWQQLATQTQPTSGDSLSESLESVLLPLWRPSERAGSEKPLAMRVVAMANGKSYDHLLEALRERHFYMATDDIYLQVRCGKNLPGDIFQSSFRPTISLIAQGTSKLQSVEIWQDNKMVKNETPPGQASILEYTSNVADRQWHSYSARILQESGAEAIVQPFWIRYIP